MAVVALMTDFGTDDPFVGIMKGVLATRAPGVPVIDVTHGVPPQAVRIGALVLAQAVPWFPSGTIHLAVVDPGVGSARRPICIERSDAVLVSPDNGVLSLAAPADRVRRIVHLTDARFFLSQVSASFHGRDVFAPVAAALATGTPPAALGPEVGAIDRLVLPEPARTGDRLRGEVIYIDRFGNLCTNLDAAALGDFPRSRLSITLGTARLDGVAASYAAVAPGALVAIVNSFGFLEIAVRDGSAAAALCAAIGDPVEVRPG
jgi:S-adenosylmethionine hydrolase